MVKRYLTPEEMKEREVIEDGEVIGYGLDSGETLSTTYLPSGEVIEEKIEVEESK